MKDLELLKAHIQILRKVHRSERDLIRLRAGLAVLQGSSTIYRGSPMEASRKNKIGHIEARLERDWARAELEARQLWDL